MLKRANRFEFSCRPQHLPLPPVRRGRRHDVGIARRARAETNDITRPLSGKLSVLNIHVVFENSMCRGTLSQNKPNESI